MSELREYKKSLRLFNAKGKPIHEETSIPHAHKIRYILVKKLNYLYNDHQDQAIANLIKDIKAIKNPLPKPTHININHPAQAKIKKVLAHAHDHYKVYYNEMMMGFGNILKTYRNYQYKGTTVASFIKRIRKNYSYDGSYEFLRKEYRTSRDADCFQTFIALIDHIALMDSSGILIKNLLKSLQRRRCTESDISHFLDDVYEIFIFVQKNYDYNLKKRDKKFLKALEEFYKIDADKLKAYYDFKVYGIGTTCSLPVVPHHTLENNLKKKLIYDVSQIAKEHKEQADNLQIQLKTLKKKIHHFSQSLGFPARIKKITLEKEPTIRKEYEKFYYVEKDIENYTYFVNAEKQKKRQIQQANKKIARLAALLTSIADGIIGATAVIATYFFFPPASVFLLAWWMGWFINNLLYKTANQEILDAFTIKKKVKNAQGELVSEPLIFLDEHGNPLSLNKKITLLSVFALTVCTGIVYGALSFMSSKSVFINMFVGISNLLSGFFASHLAVALTIFGCIGAACPAVAMLIGMTCVFFKVIADFAKNNRYQKMCDYVHENFTAPWQAMGSWRHDWKVRLLHLAKCTGRVLLLSITIVATIVFTVASMGVFYQQTLNFLSYVAKPTKIIAKVVSFVNAIVSLPFQIDEANQFLQPECQRHTFANVIQKQIELTSLSSVQRQAENVRKLGRGAVILTAAGNGACVGDMDTLSNPALLQPVKMGMVAKKINPTLLKYGTFACSTFSSTLPNGNAGLNVFKRKEPRIHIESDQKEEKALHLKFL